MQDNSTAASGVKDLIQRLRDDGVKAGREEADRILSEAKGEAARILSEARTEAEDMKAEARRAIDQEKNSAKEALRLAARDTILHLRGEVRAAFTRQLQHLISSTLQDRDILKQMILEIAGRAAPQPGEGEKTEVLAAGSLFETSQDSETGQRINRFILGISADMLREGIEIKPDPKLASGLIVRLAGEDLQIELTDETITQMLMSHILPRFRTVVEEAEEPETE